MRCRVAARLQFRPSCTLGVPPVNDLSGNTAEVGTILLSYICNYRFQQCRPGYDQAAWPTFPPLWLRWCHQTWFLSRVNHVHWSSDRRWQEREALAYRNTALWDPSVKTGLTEDGGEKELQTDEISLWKLLLGKKRVSGRSWKWERLYQLCGKQQHEQLLLQTRCPYWLFNVSDASEQSYHIRLLQEIKKHWGWGKLIHVNMILVFVLMF